MNTQNLSTLQVFQLPSRKCRSHFLQSCPKEFIRFPCERIVNLLEGNLQAIKRHQVVKFQDEVWLLLLKRTTWKQRRNFLTMNTENLSTLRVFQLFSHKCKIPLLQSCPKEYIRFLCECIINFLKGNLNSIKRHQVTNLQSKI